MLQSGGYDAHWQPVLTDWINAILQAPLTAQGFSLRQLTAKNKQVEMEFICPSQARLRPTRSMRSSVSTIRCQPVARR